MQLSIAHAAYLAGIIDGEGYVGLSRKREPTQRSGYSYRPVLSVSNTKRELLEWIAEVTQVGSICAMKKMPRCKQSWVWQTWSQRASTILQQTIPYLIIKHRQARLVIGYAAVHGQVNRRGKFGLTLEEHADQARIHSALKQLNTRGDL